METHETFQLVLSNPSADTTIDTAIAQGTIQADDAIADLVAATGGAPLPVTPVFYQGPVAGLEKEWINTSTQGINVTAAGPN